MSLLNPWPDNSNDPISYVTREWHDDFVSFLEEMQSHGAVVLADDGWSCFEFRKNNRCISFIRRGPIRDIDGRLRDTREVLPCEELESQRLQARRLGTLFGLPDYTCVVVCGLSNIRTLTMRWIEGYSPVETVIGINLWDRSETSKPLELKAQKT